MNFFKQHKWLLLAVLMFLVLTQWAIFSVNRSLWFDPAFSLQIVNILDENGIASVHFAYTDVHPPTYYYLLFGWMKINPGMTQEFWGRELSVAIGVLFIIAVYAGLRAAFGRAGEIATAFMAACSVYINFGTEIRGYMLLMLLSAVIFYCVVVGLKGWPMYVAGSCLLMMPLIHYFAGMTTIIFPLLYLWYQSHKAESNERVKQVFWDAVALFLFGLIGILLALGLYAIPQMERMEGMWLPLYDLSNFPSGVMYSMFFVEDMNARYESLGPVFSASVLVVYALLLVWMCFLIWKTFSLLGKMTSEQLLLAVMGCSVIPIIGGLLISSKGIPYYHHRFFLVITWMFAAMTFTVIVRWCLSLDSKLRRAVVFLGVGIIVGFFLLMYSLGAQHDLQYAQQAMICDEHERIIMHNSPFTMAPFDIYGREHSCNWRNVLSTDLTERMGRSAGLDVIPKENIYYDWGTPNKSYYYVSDNHPRTQTPEGAEIVRFYTGDGIKIDYVKLRTPQVSGNE